MIILFIAAGLALFALVEYLLRASIKNRASKMTDAELKNELHMGDRVGAATAIYMDELERREVSAMMIARVL